MPIVTPNWNLPTPALTDAYNLVGDLATFSSAVDGALTEVGNVFKGTASERIAFASIAVDGMLWQDTDGIKMIWRRDSTVAGNWTPAVTRWTGTTAQMNAFTQAPNGFAWFNSTDNSEYVRLGGAWVLATRVDQQIDTVNSTIKSITQVGSGRIAGTGAAFVAKAVTFPVPFARTPRILVTSQGSSASGAFNDGGLSIGALYGVASTKSASGFTAGVMAPGGSVPSGTQWYFDWIAIGEPA